jgi:hypothetical protein
MLENSSEMPTPKKLSVFKLMLTVTLRILGIRTSQTYEDGVGQLTAMQVGYACLFAFIAFIVIIGLLCVAVVKLMS